MKKFLVPIVLVGLLCGDRVLAKERFSHFFLGVELGTWKPTSLGAEQALAPKLLPGTRPLLGFKLVSMIRGDVGLEASVEHWEQYELDSSCAASRVRIVPVSLSFRHRLSDVSWIAPFADYGLLMMFGFQKARITGEWNRHSGFGVLLGAGVEAFLGRRLQLVLRAGYVYAKFPKTIGETDNYSGPILSMSALLGL